jgi:hypothetical protein
MTQINGLIFNLLYLAPYFLLPPVFLLFFYKAIRKEGIEKLRIFTAGMAGLGGAFLLLLPTGIDWTWVLPVRLIAVPTNYVILNIVLFCLLTYYIVACLIIRKERTVRYLVSMWVIVTMFNMADMARHA